MPSVLANAVVRLHEDDPTHALKRGTEGVVVCVWPSSNGLLCEVEFRSSGQSPAIRALLPSQQLEIVELQPARDHQ